MRVYGIAAILVPVVILGGFVVAGYSTDLFFSNNKIAELQNERQEKGIGVTSQNERHEKEADAIPQKDNDVSEYESNLASDNVDADDPKEVVVEPVIDEYTVNSLGSSDDPTQRDEEDREPPSNVERQADARTGGGSADDPTQRDEEDREPSTTRETTQRDEEDREPSTTRETTQRDEEDREPSTTRETTQRDERQENPRTGGGGGGSSGSPPQQRQEQREEQRQEVEYDEDVCLEIIGRMLSNTSPSEAELSRFERELIANNCGNN